MNTDLVRVLRSAPAVTMWDVAKLIGVHPATAQFAMDKLQGRGRCDQLTATAMAPYARIEERMDRDQQETKDERGAAILRAGMCPPFTARRLWRQGRRVVEAWIGPGVANWAARQPNATGATRNAVLYGRGSWRESLAAAAQPHCPTAMVIQSATTGWNLLTRRLAEEATQPVVIAALAANNDRYIRRTVASRSELPSALRPPADHPS